MKKRSGGIVTIDDYAFNRICMSIESAVDEIADEVDSLVSNVDDIYVRTVAEAVYENDVFHDSTIVSDSALAPLDIPENESLFYAFAHDVEKLWKEYERKILGF